MTVLLGVQVRIEIQVEQLIRNLINYILCNFFHITVTWMSV